MKSLRKDIDQIHINLFKLLMERKKTTQKIWKLKKNNQLKYTDLNRELYLIHQFDNTKQLKGDPELQKYYHSIVKSILRETKKYLKATQNLK